LGGFLFAAIPRAVERARLMSASGTKRARAYSTDVRSWWKLTYERSVGIRVLTHSRQATANFAVMHNVPSDVLG
jgi:hypothetical protein